MWELIQASKRKSWILFIAMGIFLLLVGYVIGVAWFGAQYGVIGLYLALCIWFILSLVSYFSGDSILLSVSRAKAVSRDVHPQLFNVVEEMKLSANLPVMPKIYIIDEPAPNAFATGRSPEKSSIAVTAGLLSRLNRDELQGVIAHEMSHIINRDVLYMTFAGVMLGSIVMLSHVFLRSMWYSSSSSRRYRSSSSSRDGGGAQVIMLVVAVVLAILAPLIARLFYFSLSRRREYLADASAVRLTRYPEGLASALEKIASAHIPLPSANPITASMYIANPLQKKRAVKTNLWGTHPPLLERIAILKNMTHGANYRDYQQAFMSAKGKSTSIMPTSALSDSEPIPLRHAMREQTSERSTKKRARDVGDLMRTLNKYVFLSCLCGMRIKVPPQFKGKEIKCTRCGRSVEVPLSDIKTIGSMIDAQK
ncbi:MAG: M48 family metallopeptidase [Candidatus Omnitrophica bacterium]|nr:M48 family metallopeptidase [Candidatus Omnitrophota bacterium]